MFCGHSATLGSLTSISKTGWAYSFKQKSLKNNNPLSTKGVHTVAEGIRPLTYGSDAMAMAVSFSASAWCQKEHLTLNQKLYQSSVNSIKNGNYNDLK